MPPGPVTSPRPLLHASKQPSRRKLPSRRPPLWPVTPRLPRPRSPRRRSVTTWRSPLPLPRQTLPAPTRSPRRQARRRRLLSQEYRARRPPPAPLPIRAALPRQMRRVRPLRHPARGQHRTTRLTPVRRPRQPLLSAARREREAVVELTARGRPPDPVPRLGLRTHPADPSSQADHLAHRAAAEGVRVDSVSGRRNPSTDLLRAPAAQAATRGPVVRGSVVRGPVARTL
jgi:hypothetical protein